MSLCHCGIRQTQCFQQVWHVLSHQILYDFGRVPAYNMALQKEDTIFCLQQENCSFKEPFRTTQIKLPCELFSEYKLEQEVKFVPQDRFVTPYDKHLLILTAEFYNEFNALQVNPSVCTVAPTVGLLMTSVILSDNLRSPELCKCG